MQDANGNNRFKGAQSTGAILIVSIPKVSSGMENDWDPEILNSLFFLLGWPK